MKSVSIVYKKCQTFFIYFINLLFHYCINLTYINEKARLYAC